ncbi:glycosyl hydrolase [Geopyxis carbonaria]|nr:glycosyl hydrolase [Geopyxis carbonaria]
MKFIFLPLLLLQLVHAFNNPIIPGFNPDPSISRVGDDYFLVTSTFEYFPGIPLYHSRDLIEWDLIGHVLNRPSQLNLRGTAPSGGVFAPTLRYHEKEHMWYCIGTVFDVISPPDITHTPRSFYVKTADIFDESSWSDPVYVDQTGFDPDLFFDPVSSKTYLTTTMGAQFVDASSGYFAIWLTEIDLATGTSKTESEILHISSLPLSAPRLAEGSHIYYINSTYYLLTAEGGTEAGSHRSMISRAPSMAGPWESNPQNPILWNGRNTSNPVLATGHADLVSSPDGKWYAVFLGTRPQAPTNITGRAQLGRETFLAPVTWKDGWPVVNGGKAITENMPTKGLRTLPRPKKWRDDFRGGKLGDKAWYTPRTPYKAFHGLEKSGNGLTLWGNVYNLTHRETPATLLRKQVDLETLWSTELDFAPKSHRHEAGATVFLSIHYHNTIAVTLHPSTSARVVKTVTHSGTVATANTTYHEIPKTGKVRLYIKAQREKYDLGYSTGGGKVNWVADVESKWLQAWLSGWQCFTGTFLGVYASGNGLPMPGVPAKFGWVQTELL